MSKEKFRLENKLGTSGVMTAIVLVVTTMITGLLFSVSSFLRFILHNSLRMQSFLEVFGIEDTKIHNTFNISRSISWLGSVPAIIILMTIIVLLLIVWVLFYKLNSVYIYRAFRGYGLSLVCISGVLLIFGIFINVFIYNFSKETYLDYQSAFQVGKWLAVFAVMPIFVLGLLMLFISLFAAFPAKTDMKRPRRNGEKDVSFIMDDEDINQISKDSLLISDIKKPLEEQLNDVQEVEAEIVQKVCPKCGLEAKDDDIFCVECGTKL